MVLGFWLIQTYGNQRNDQFGYIRILRFGIQSIALDLSTIRTHPSNRHEPAIVSFVKPLHQDRAILVLTNLVFDVWHKDVYNFKQDKCNWTKIRARILSLNNS